jgi:5-methylcytosine-specific restriction protein A
MCADGCANGALALCADAPNVSALTLLTHTVPYRGSDGAPHGDCATTPTPRCKAAARQSGTVALSRPVPGGRALLTPSQLRTGAKAPLQSKYSSLGRAREGGRPMAKQWDHGGKTRQQRGYGREHEAIRADLITTVILCEECTRRGRITPGTIADHIKPLAQGGTGDRSNYQLLCRPCDLAKQATDRGQTAHAKRPAIGLDGWPIERKKP